MTAKIHLVLGPPGSQRKDRLIAAYRRAAATFGAALLLTPTRRHAAQIRAAATVAIAPQIFDLQSFADELVRTHQPATRPHSDVDRLLLLESIAFDLCKGNELPYFASVAETRGFAEAAVGYIAELKAAGIDYRQLLKVSPSRSEYTSADRRAQAALIFQRYNRQLAKRNRLDPPDRIGRAAELWSSGKHRPFDRVRSAFLLGFTSFGPFERKLIDALRESLEEVWLELPEGEGEAFRETAALCKWLAAPVGEPSLWNVKPEVATERIAPSAKGSGLWERLFAPADIAQPSSECPPGLSLIEAPGELGEARLVARHIRQLLAEGIEASRILIVSRRLTRAVAELYREAFHEYGLDFDIEGTDALNRVPAIAFLLQAWRVPEEDWPLASVTAILRSTHFRPNWPELKSDPEVAAKAEVLLRMLGETRGRNSYLAAVHTWEFNPPEPLEDERADEPTRRRKQQLAARCRPFLERFFQAWDRLKPTGSAPVSVARFKEFAEDIGAISQASADGGDPSGLARFWQELERWARTEAVENGRKSLRPERFARAVATIASAPCRGRTPRNAGCIALLSAEAAVGLECDYLFMIGLGEGSWPDLSPPRSLLDDRERERLRKLRFALADSTARQSGEKLLFLELAASPRRGTILSYPAIDERGQRLLPSTFLRELKRCIAPHSIPTVRQRMPLDGYFEREPLSAAELRVQVAREWRSVGPKPPLPADLLDNLQRAAAAADARFHSDRFGPFDGELRHPAVAAELAVRYGPEKVLSATALETYVACPFRFWLERILRLEPLENPKEEVEHTRRGAAFHRALARFHTSLSGAYPKEHAFRELPPEATERLLAELERAIEEYASRAPSRASAELWRLEGLRLRRSARRYCGHWHAFREPWIGKNTAPHPLSFEADFGVLGDHVPEPLTVSVGGVEVRIGGRIDRVDVADLGGTTGFWVIDYKTGRASNYQASQVERFEKLQLPLYALAVERVLLKDRPSRPLGLAYWMVTDGGVKPMLPSGKKSVLAWLADPERWERFRTQLESWVSSLVEHIRAGDFPLAPRSEHCTDVCRFGPVCRISQSRTSGKRFALPLPILPKEKETRAEA